MKLHPRHNIVTKADIEASQAVCDAVMKHGLTNAELDGNSTESGAELEPLRDSG